MNLREITKNGWGIAGLVYAAVMLFLVIVILLNQTQAAAIPFIAQNDESRIIHLATPTPAPDPIISIAVEFDVLELNQDGSMRGVVDNKFMCTCAELE